MLIKARIKQSILLLAIGIAVNIALVAVKLYVGMSSNSLTIMLDAANSIFDVLTSAVTLIAFALLFIPRSAEAPFGYGRSEYLAGFIVAVASAVVGGLFMVRSVNRLAMPEPVWFGWQSCVLIAVAIPVKLALALLYFIKNKKLKSKAISAIALDCCLDVGITGASLVAFAVTSKVDYAADAIFGIVISALILVFAIKMIADNVRSVVRGDGCVDELAAIKKRVKQDSLIKRVGNITLHDYGFGAKSGTVEVVFKKEIGRAEIESAERRLREDIKDECGAEIWLVPLADEDLTTEIRARKDSKGENVKRDKSDEN